MPKDEFKSISEIEKQERKKEREKRKSDINTAKNKELVKNFFVILIITVIAGGILGFVHELTKEPIAQTEALEKLRASQRVFSNASSFEEVDIAPETLNLFLPEDTKNIILSDLLYALSEDGEALGFIVTVTTNEGYGGNISFTMGVTLDGVLNGISITEINETPGLGMRAEEVLVPQFTNKNATAFELTKQGALMDYQIDAISSATITSTAVTKAVNAGYSAVRSIINGGAYAK